MKIHIFIFFSHKIIKAPEIKKMSSSTGDQAIQDPFKSWKFLVLPTIKITDIFTSFFKTIVIICIITSISLIFFFAFSNQPLCFPEYKIVLGNFNPHQNISTTPDPNTNETKNHQKTNITHILFGIGASSKTWNQRKHYSELWWKPNITRGFVWLDDNPPKKEVWSNSSPPYKISQDTSRFKYSCWYGSRSAIRMARIVKESFELGLDNVRWFVMGDDDTVFFTENLVTVLGKYDHNQMYYIGSNSESVEQDLVHSYTMAYGGGGFAISYPLAAELVNILDGCIDRYDQFYGSDQKVQGCLSEIGVPLTKELGFHQIDIRGDPYGLLAAHPIAPLVSLHHVDYVQPLFPTMNQIDSVKKLTNVYKMDPSRTLQQSFCYDLKRKWSISVSWGYTVQLYPSLVTAKKLETALQTFRTWRTWGPDPFIFNTQTVNPSPCDRPIVYFLDRVEMDGTGRTSTTYKRYKPRGEEDCDRLEFSSALSVEFFNVTSTQFNNKLWNMAPRRQCCEVIDGGDRKQRVMEVQIRGCNRFESVTPP